MTEQKRAFGYTMLVCLLIVVVVVAGLFAYVAISGLASENSSPEADYRRLYGSTPIVGWNYSFSPPIPMYRAIIIGLQSDEWNASSLENMTVHVSLDYYVFYTNVSALYQLASQENLTLTGYPNPDLNMTGGYGYELIHEVTAPVDDYRPQIFNGVSLRYVWSIVVQENSGMCIPPPGCYLVDAATAELIPTGPLF
jgi:heme/copper-type cytochrome/quinol oxidase subunit 2